MADFRINVVVDPTRAKTGAAVVNRELTGMQQRASNLGATLRRAFGFLATGIIARQVVGTLASFGQEMSTVGAVTNATAEQFAALEERAISLGTNTRFTATQAAAGLTELARAGLTVDEAMVAVGTSLNLAQAGGLSIAESAAIATTAVKVFKLEVEDAAVVADTLVIAANNTKTNVGEMGQAFTFVAANAKDLNINVEDTAAALGVLAEGGLTATRGGTALRAVLLGLAAPTREAEAALRDAGLTLDDIDIKSRGLEPVLKTLSAAQLDSAAKAAIFGKRFSAASSILFENLDKFGSLNTQFETLAGETERVARAMDDNLNGSLLALRSAFEGLILRVGGAGATGALRTFIDTMTNGLRFAAENVDEFIVKVEGLAFVVGTTLAKRAIGSLIGSIRALGVAIATNPLGAFLTVATLAVGALISFRNDIKLTEGSITTLADVATVAWDQIKAGIESFSALFSEFGDIINASLGGVFDGFTLDLQTVLLGIATFADASLGLFLGLGNSLTALFTGLPRAIGSGILQILGGINNFIESGLDRVLALFGAVGNTAKQLGLSLSVFFNELDASLTFLAQGQGELAATTASQASEVLLGQIAGIGDTFSREFSKELEAAADERTLEPIVNIFEGAGQEMAANMTAGFEEGLSFDGLTGFTLRTFEAANAMAAARQAAENQAAVTDGLADPLDTAAAAADNYAESLEGAAAASESLNTAGAGLSTGLELGLKGITDVAGAAESLVVNGFGAAEDAIVDFATTGQFSFSEFVDGLLADVARLLARQALTSLLGAFGGPGGAIAGIIGGARAEGGPVNPNQAFLVGEEGPELFVPPGAGNVMSAAETAAAAPGGGTTVVNAPPVNVSVVNVTDPSEAVSALDTPEGEQVVMNIIARNRTNINNSLA